MAAAVVALLPVWSTAPPMIDTPLILMSLILFTPADNVPPVTSNEPVAATAAVTLPPVTSNDARARPSNQSVTRTPS